MYTIETTRDFTEFNLNPLLLSSLSDRGFEKASPIQELTIPTILEGKDIFAQAETGSGKTGSFAIPILEQILKDPESDNIYIVMSPTRELAQQTNKVFGEFGAPLNIKSVCVMGGTNMDAQKKELQENPKIIVATPGRLCDLVRQKFVDTKKCCCVVFDEADRLFEMGFQKDIEQILRGVQKDRQLIMVSATSNQEVLRTAYKFHSHPEELKLNEDDLLVDNINHEVAMISEQEKMPYLVHLLRSKPDAYAIIFCNTQYMTHLVAIWLEQMGFKVEAISGRLAQNKRTSLMTDFRSKKISILVCTDVAARGLDIKDVNLVVNYDLPHEAPNYVHRIGRTGRAGKSGLAVSFCAYDDCENLDAISEYIDAKIPKSDIEDDHFATDLTKKPWIDSKTLKVIDRNKQNNSNSRNKSKNSKEPYKAKAENNKARKDMNETRKPKSTEKKTYNNKERLFVVTSSNAETAKAQALKHFAITDETLLDTIVLEEGRKKFFFFGAKSVKYQFKVKAIYKKILQPYLIDLFKKMDLKIFVRVSYKAPNVRISFSGKDAGDLVKNRYELQNSVEEISLSYLGNKVAIPRGTKLSFRTEKAEDKKKTEKYLIGLAQKIKDQVLKEDKPVLMKSLNPADRRVVHQYISEDGKFNSSSVGDGRFKQIEISLK